MSACPAPAIERLVLADPVPIAVVLSPAATMPGHDPEVILIGTCRDCLTEYRLPIYFVGRVGRSKWSSLCPSCIALEL